MESFSLRVTEDTAVSDPNWPEADVVVLPGLPGWQPGEDERLVRPFPTTTTDMVKILRSEGLTVEHVVERGERQEVSLNAAEYWVPVLVFALDVAANTSGELLSSAITQLFGKSLLRKARLHVRFGQQRPDGTVDFFEAHGEADKVIEAMRAHAKTRRAKRKKP